MAARDRKTTGADTVTLPIGDLTVTFKKPTDGQIAALRRAAQLFAAKDTATQGQGGMIFLDVLDNLVTDQAILNRVYSDMATNKVELATYAEAAIQLMKHFSPEPAAPTNGPVSTRRRAGTPR